MIEIKLNIHNDDYDHTPDKLVLADDIDAPGKIAIYFESHKHEVKMVDTEKFYEALQVFYETLQVFYETRILK